MFVREYLIIQWVMKHVICIGLVLEVENIFRVNVLVGHTRVGGKMLKFIGRKIVNNSDLTTKQIVYSAGICGLRNAHKNKTVVKIPIIIASAYSAVNNKANGPVVYSTLEPGTSSDSPSLDQMGSAGFC